MITLVVMVLLIVGFLSGKFKLGLVAMSASTILCLTGVLDFEEAYVYLADSNVIMVGSIFVLSGALSKTSLVPVLKDLIMKHSDKGGLIIFLYLLANAILTILGGNPSPVMILAAFLYRGSAFDAVYEQHGASERVRIARGGNGG